MTVTFGGDTAGFEGPSIYGEGEGVTYANYDGDRAFLDLTPIFFRDIPLIPLVPQVTLTAETDTHDGGPLRDRTRLPTRPEPVLPPGKPLFIIEPEEPDEQSELTDRGRAVVQAVLSEATTNSELQNVEPVAALLRDPGDDEAELALARAVALGQLASELSREFEDLVARIERENDDIEALIALGLL